MAFTYADSLLTDRDAIRLRIADTVVSKGPRPDKRNFSDAEIAFILDEEDDRVNGAIAHAFEILASEWSSYALSEKEGELDFDAKEVAENFRKQAVLWRKKPGGGSEVEMSGSLVEMQRVDAYS